MNLPNTVTIARLISVPLIVWLIVNEDLDLAFWLFLVAGLSDALDGFLARWLNACTELGVYLEPVADKTLLVSMFVILGYRGDLSSWLVILVVSRDLLIVGGVLLSWIAGLQMSIQPHAVSKLNTACQTGLVCLVLANAGYGFLAPQPQVALAIMAGSILVALTTVLSGADYLAGWLRTATAWERDAVDHAGSADAGAGDAHPPPAIPRKRVGVR